MTRRTGPAPAQAVAYPRHDGFTRSFRPLMRALVTGGGGWLVHVVEPDCEVVFHQAALPSVPRSVQDPLTSNAVNVIGTINVLLCATCTSRERAPFWCAVGFRGG